MNSIVRYQRIAPYTLRDAVDSVFNAATRAAWPTNGAFAASVPPANLYETPDAFNVVVALPGVDPDQLDVTIKERVMTVAGKRHLPTPEPAQPIWRSIAEGEFSFTFNLPAPVTAESVEARYEHGLLLLNLPKLESARARRIQVKSGNWNGHPPATETEPA